jgi:glycosyltransferase involved in cell wall biosynthesis
LALCRNEELRTRLAQGAIQRSCAYSWQAKMKNLDEVYQTTVASYRPIAEDEFHPVG